MMNTYKAMLAALAACAISSPLRAQSFPAGGIGAHFADGGGWTTTLLLTNFGNTNNPVRVSFFGTNGNSLSVTYNVDGATTTNTDSSRDFDLKPSQTVRLVTAGASSAVATGWVNVHGVGANRPVTGTVVFRQTVSGRPDYEASIPLDYIGKSSLLLQYDNSSGLNSAIALVNAAAGRSTITITAWDETGKSLGENVVDLSAMNQVSFVLSERLPTTAGQRGFLWIRSTMPGVAALGLRFNKTGAFTTLSTWN
jgi:hypothetical protein